MASDQTIIEYLGEQYAGRRYVRYVDLVRLGLVGNRRTLRTWIELGVFPGGIRLPSKHGTTLVWSTAEIAQTLADRHAERDSKHYPQQQGASRREARLFYGGPEWPSPS
jgi:hypothetical protein